MADAPEEPETPASNADPVTERALGVLETEHADSVVASEMTGAHPWIQVKAEGLADLMRTLRDHDDTQLDCCHLITGVDYPGKGKDVGEIEVLYHLCSYAKREDAAYFKRAEKNDPWVAIKVRVPRDAPNVPTVMEVWTGADWHERETYDLVGVRFTGRPDLRRILLPEDWPGHPLRKDWETPASYHGIPIIAPEDL
ncbi:MAG: NADH-quinone oxidoreductase subunit C [Planctomycetota bacterium]|nr:NADH-quinone oxidoreductase subunit C [Planctomycetota bacterium]